MGILFVLYKIINTQTYHFTFIDSDTGEVILNTRIQADLILQGETPETFVSDNNGGITFRTDQSSIRLAVTSPCYRQDTIKRILKKFNRHENIRLHSDPYALMIQYFHTAI